MDEIDVLARHLANKAQAAMDRLIEDELFGPDPVTGYRMGTNGKPVIDITPDSRKLEAGHDRSR